VKHGHSVPPRYQPEVEHKKALEIAVSDTLPTFAASNNLLQILNFHLKIMLLYFCSGQLQASQITGRTDVLLTS